MALVKHIVTFRFLPGVSQDTKKEVAATYTALKSKCVLPTTGELYILSFDGGVANSPEGLDQKMEQGYVLTFKSVEDRNYFVWSDPDHAAFKSFLKDKVDGPDGAFVFDFIVAV